MRLIKKIEISYLRSLYKAIIFEANDLNVLFGRNDSGKSNVLRALNLFFNEETDLDRDVDFGIDFSDVRREQAQKGASRQFFSIKIWFNVPSNYRRSLGKEIYVKRQWNRTGDMSESLPRNLSKGSRIQLTKFLSSIDYTYIPAIKDLSVFEDLIQRMYNATAEGRGLKTSTEEFINSIREETDDLSRGLAAALGASAKLAAPNEMGLIFRSLDFSHGDNEHSLLLQKGDGIKARHIPELLRYINEKERGVKFFLWGFEEPENSLDLAASKAEASNFLKIASRSDTQVFVSSHSPAFYLNNEESEHVSRFFVDKQISDGKSKVIPRNAISLIDEIDQAESKMRSASLIELPFVIRSLDRLSQENANLQKISEELEQKIQSASRPILFVEGAHDIRCLNVYLNDRMADIDVKELGGTPTTTSEIIKRTVEGGISFSNRPILFLFDNDRSGRSAYKNLAPKSQPDNRPQQVTDSISVWAWPTSDEFDTFIESYSIPLQNRFFPIEFMFEGGQSAELLMGLMSNDELSSYEDRIHEDYFKSLSQEKVNALRGAKTGTSEWFWSRGVPDSHKAKFLRQAKSKLGDSRMQAALDEIVAVLS